MESLLLTETTHGGAGMAIKRIYEGLKDIEVDAHMYVRQGGDSVDDIIRCNGLSSRLASKIRIRGENLITSFYDPKKIFYPGLVPTNLTAKIAEIDPDVVHLNWMSRGFLNPASLSKVDQPIVWRLPDMWPMTGGCHFSWGCNRFKNECGQCPQLNSSRDYDISRLGLKLRRYGVKNSKLTVVANSEWLATQAAESTVFQEKNIKVIRNAIDTSVFKPLPTDTARTVWDLPKDTPLVLFGADLVGKERKGFDLLYESLELIHEKTHSITNQVELAVFGTDNIEYEFHQPLHKAGYVADERSLALLYSAADVMVVPSRYEGLANTMLESMACGTPVVTFDAAGNPDAISHKQSGYLAEAYSTKDLMRGIIWALRLPDNSTVSDNAREWIEQHCEMESVAREYLDLYKSIC